MKKFGHYGLWSLLCLILLFVTPSLSFATTEVEDWTVSHSLPVSVYDTEGGLVFSVSRCRSLFALSPGVISAQFTLSAEATLSSKAEYAIKFARGHENCTKTSLDAESGESCRVLVSRSALTSANSPITVSLGVDSLSAATSEDLCEDLAETSYLYLIINDPEYQDKENIYTLTYALDFRTTRPQAPTEVLASAGEVSIQASWKEVAGAVQYYVYYGQGLNMKAGDYPEDYENQGASKIVTSSNSAKVASGLTVGNSYDLAVVSVDTQGNESVLSEVLNVQTEASNDFWEAFRKENQDVEGGYCFLATAAWGSTQESHVSLLRQFRDEILMQNVIGQKFVRTYYKYSPPLAYFIQQHPTARAIARVALWPVYGVAFAVLHAPTWAWLLLGLLFCAALGLGLKRKFSSRRASKAIVTSLALLAACATLLGKPADVTAEESPVDMMVEFKYGPYAPDSLGEPYETYFGEGTSYLIELEYDWQFYRGIGSLGVGFHLGYGSVSGTSKTETGEASVDETSMSWLPLRLSLIYRMDWLWLNLNFPFVIYGKIGFDYAFWWIKNGAGEVSTDGASTGTGGTWGWHGVAGLAFVLDWFSPSMSTSIDVDWGINNSYIFVEYVYYSINNFGTGGVMDLSDSLGFHVGLAIEF